MRPLHKRKSLYYGCKVRNRAAICACNEPKFELARNLGEYRDSEPARARFWEDKHMRKNLTEIVFILDRSGSMSGLERDTIGGAIHHIGNVHKYARPEDVPEHTMFVITTDGMENASRRYNSEKVKQMIERQKAKYGWEFLFLGANIDAVETASQFGIGADRAVNYQCDSEGTALNYEVVSEAISSVRCSAPLSADWKKRIDGDYKKRGGRKHK